MSKKFSTIFFDWGGVVAMDPGDDFLTSLLLNVGASEDQTQEIYDSYLRRFMRGDLAEAAFWQELREKYNLSIPDTISNEFKKWRGLVADQDVVAFIKRLKAEGYGVAVLTNVIEPTFNVLEQAGFYAMFDAVIASCKEHTIKPEDKIYQIALERMDATPETSIFIDDKQKYLDPAKALGFTTVLAKDPAQIIRDVTALIANWNHTTAPPEPQP